MSRWKDKELKNIKYLFYAVSDENIRQLEKWGVQDHSPFIWITALTEEVGELSEATLKQHFGGSNHGKKQVYNEAIQVATLALKIAEMNMEE